MKKLEILEMDAKNFSKYGTFRDMLNPEGAALGEPPGEYFRDLTGMKLGSPQGFVSFSVFKGARQEGRQILKAIEYHSKCGEAILPLDGDCVLGFAKATPPGVVPDNEIEAILIPKGKMAVIEPGSGTAALSFTDVIL